MVIRPQKSYRNSKRIKIMNKITCCENCLKFKREGSLVEMITYCSNPSCDCHKLIRHHYQEGELKTHLIPPSNTMTKCRHNQNPLACTQCILEAPTPPQEDWAKQVEELLMVCGSYALSLSDPRSEPISPDIIRSKLLYLLSFSALQARNEAYKEVREMVANEKEILKKVLAKATTPNNIAIYEEKIETVDDLLNILTSLEEKQK